MFSEPFMQFSSCQLLVFYCTVLISHVLLNWVKESNRFAPPDIDISRKDASRN